MQVRACLALLGALEDVAALPTLLDTLAPEAREQVRLLSSLEKLLQYCPTYSFEAVNINFLDSKVR